MIEKTATAEDSEVFLVLKSNDDNGVPKLSSPMDIERAEGHHKKPSTKKTLSMRSIVRKGVVVGLSFAISLSMNVFNTFLFSKHRYNIDVPLFVGALYDLTQFSLAAAITMVVEWKSGPGVIGSFRMLSNRQFFRFILPCGVAAGCNVALSNSSLRYISLSLYTMVKSCGPVFVLVFAFLFGLETATPNLLGIMAIIGVGIVLTVWHAFDFHLLGFILVFMAAIVSSVRWTLTQLIIENSSSEDIDEGNAISGSGPMRTMLFLAPVITLSLLVLSLIFEGPLKILQSSFFSSWSSGLFYHGIGLVGGIQSFLLVLLEYKIVQETSVLTFSILGIIKELVIIATSVLVFGDRIRLINLTGAIVSIIGIVMYNIYKSSKMAQLTTEERKQKRTAGVAMRNMFMAVPTAEPSWLLDPMNVSTESVDSTTYFWSFAPQPSPTETFKRQDSHVSPPTRRTSVYDGTRSTSRHNSGIVGGSLKSSRESSPGRHFRDDSRGFAIELNKL